jgi:hypothetical protein
VSTRIKNIRGIHKKIAYGLVAFNEEFVIELLIKGLPWELEGIIIFYIVSITRVSKNSVLFAVYFFNMALQ